MPKGTSTCAICAAPRDIAPYRFGSTPDDAVTVALCTGRGKKVHPKSCAGLVASGAIKIEPWDATTIRYRCDDHAARVLSARGRNVKQGLGYFAEVKDVTT